MTGSTGQPLAEAQVVIVGTAFGAVTNAHGYYFINNLPAGQVEVRATFIGYQPVEVQGLRILAGQTLTQDFTLDPRVLELEQITVIAAANVLVPRDEVTTRQRLDGRYTDALPVDRVAQALILQPGVIAGSQRSTLSISIRGGRTDEAAVYIDGVPVNPGYRGGAESRTLTQLLLQLPTPRHRSSRQRSGGGVGGERRARGGVWERRSRGSSRSRPGAADPATAAHWPTKPTNHSGSATASGSTGSPGPSAGRLREG